MQKKIIALAIAAAFSAPAFADVQVYGLVDLAVAHVSADKQQSDTQLVSGGLSTSRIGLKSASDMGNGMKALVNLEYKIDGAASTTLVSARNELLGVAGDFGTFAGGYLQTTAWDWQNSFDPTSGSTVSPLGNLESGGGMLVGSTAAAARASRALAYISPKMGGVTVAVNYSTALADSLGNLGVADTKPATKVNAYLMSVNYAEGPIAAGLVYAKMATASGEGEKKDIALGGSYDLGVAKLFATYQNSKTAGTSTPAVAAHYVFNTTSGLSDLVPATTAVAAGPEVTNKAKSVSAVIPAGPGAVVVSYAKLSSDAADKGASGETVGYLYNVTTTETIYAAYSHMSQDKNASTYSVDNNAVKGTANGSSSMIAVGLRKKF